MNNPSEPGSPSQVKPRMQSKSGKEVAPQHTTNQRSSVEPAIVYPLDHPVIFSGAVYFFLFPWTLFPLSKPLCNPRPPPTAPLSRFALLPEIGVELSRADIIVL